MKKYEPMKLIICRFPLVDIICSSSDPAGSDGDWALFTANAEGGNTL